MDKSLVIDGQLYWHESLLKNWHKNEEARMITTENFLKLKADIKKNGIEDPFKIDNDGTVYDGNNRLKVIRELLKEGITQNDLGQDLSFIPVKPKEYVKESEKWRSALSRNGHYAQWTENLGNYTPEFEDELDVPLINVSFQTPKSLDEQIVSSPAVSDEEETATKEKKPQQVTCPQCNHSFTV